MEAALVKELRQQETENSVSNTVGNIDLSIFGVECQPHGVEKPAERTFDFGERRYIAIVSDIPHSHKAQVRIEPGVFRHLLCVALQRDIRVQILVQVIRRGNKYL